MAQLIVRKLEDEIVHRLEQRAALDGRSAEAEHREILREVLGAPQNQRSFEDHLRGIPASDDDFDFERIQAYPRAIDF